MKELKVSYKKYLNSTTEEEFNKTLNDAMNFSFSDTQMKQLEFKTAKCEFVLVDNDSLNIVSGQALVDEYGDYITLKNITEEEASILVDSCIDFFDGENGYLNYQYKNGMFSSAIDSLHSLIKSKGVHLYENPQTKIVDDNYSKSNRILWEKAEANTFYNPIIFIKSK